MPSAVPRDRKHPRHLATPTIFDKTSGEKPLCCNAIWEVNQFAVKCLKALSEGEQFVPDVSRRSMNSNGYCLREAQMSYVLRRASARAAVWEAQAE